MKYILPFLLFTLTIASCQKEEMASKQYRFVKPEHFPEPYYTFDQNPVTQKGFELGKRIFGDPILSRDGSVACNNCHVKSVAFTDPQHPMSLGVEERSGTRNAPSIANMAFMKEFMWDGGVHHLDFAAPNAITNPLEMDETLSHVVWKMNQHGAYPALFKSAFPTMGDTITSPFLLQALSQYQCMLVSATSKYDHYKMGDSDLTPDELEGLQLFEQKCATCHSGELFTNQEYRNNGLATDFPDLGRAKITENSSEIGAFKVPSLRNVALTSPYMHDARFKTLEEVLDHYASGVKQSPTLAAELNQNGTLGVPLSPTEKARIIDFLKTLTDHEFIQDTRF